MADSPDICLPRHQSGPCHWRLSGSRSCRQLLNVAWHITAAASAEAFNSHMGQRERERGREALRRGNSSLYLNIRWLCPIYVCLMSCVCVVLEEWFENKLEICSLSIESRYSSGPFFFNRGVLTQIPGNCRINLCSSLFCKGIIKNHISLNYSIISFSNFLSRFYTSRSVTETLW